LFTAKKRNDDATWERVFSLAGGLSVLGFLATDMYLPFAAIQSDLQTPASAVSASLSLFLPVLPSPAAVGTALTTMVANLFCCWVYLSSPGQSGHAVG
jgi:hypothetical protein